MCCTANPALTRKLRARKRNFVAYKVILREGKSGIFRHMVYKPGVNVPEERVVKPCLSKAKFIGCGALHLYRTRACARMMHCQDVIIAVSVNPKTVLGADETSLAVSLVRISKAAWKKARLK